MDAVKFVNERNRMCRHYDDCCKCPLDGMACAHFLSVNIETVVPIVEQWAKEHPIKTRQSAFLEQFPNAPIYTDMHTVALNPCLVDTTLQGHCPKGGRCDDCRREFWMQEVE